LSALGRDLTVGGLINWHSEQENILENYAGIITQKRTVPQKKLVIAPVRQALGRNIGF